MKSSVMSSGGGLANRESNFYCYFTLENSNLYEYYKAEKFVSLVENTNIRNYLVQIGKFLLCCIPSSFVEEQLVKQQF